MQTIVLCLALFVLSSFASACAGVEPEPCAAATHYVIPAGGCAFVYDAEAKGTQATSHGLSCETYDASAATYYEPAPGSARELLASPGASVAVADGSSCAELYRFATTGDF